MDNKNSSSIWNRRPNTSNLSLSTSQTDSAARDFSSLSAARRNGGPTSSHGKPNPFSATTPGSGLASPTGGGSSAFGLGSGAFASFGAVGKTPKTPGNPFEMAMGSIGSGKKTPATEKTSSEALRSASGRMGPGPSHPLRHTWIFWTRPPISKANGRVDYDKTLHPMARVATLEEFWTVHRHLKRPSELPVVTDYHFFKEGVRPIWEDDENKEGGKWTLRMKKGIADLYWTETMMALIGDALSDGSDEMNNAINGMVLSVRNGEDILSIWTSGTDSIVLKVRDMLKSWLKCPSNTIIEFKSHTDSMTQRAQIDEQRREKAANNHHNNNNNNNNNDNKRTGASRQA
ncbi:translation initiation factor eif4e3 protein [Apiospora kogelbergensis]|uniref:Translation initiation factor eif4e3 protein n=1 Tax=Apiospora kogelbergensis TaxID=1337665 RepID=A0AAW0QE53_9PEZI